jgi:hypothetical protein
MSSTGGLVSASPLFIYLKKLIEKEEEEQPMKASSSF